MGPRLLLHSEVEGVRPVAERPAVPSSRRVHHAQAAMGRAATIEEKRRATDQLLAVYDRLGVATIGR